jgi:hypothetical protein
VYHESQYTLERRLQVTYECYWTTFPETLTPQYQCKYLRTIFTALEDKHEELGLSDYSVSQPTLEQGLNYLLHVNDHSNIAIKLTCVVSCFRVVVRAYSVCEDCPSQSRREKR